MSKAAELAALIGSQSALSHRNFVINGAMTIHQRGGSISATGFPVDRFGITEQTSATFTGEQSTTAPTGFTNSLLITIGTGASATSTQYAIIAENIEGNNIARLGFGASGAKNVTLSFWVRSSVTGTFCASIKNSAANRVYIMEYTISVADTWEYKTLTFPGDTTGTWLTDNGIGIRLAFDLGSGSGTPTGAENSWITTNATRTSNQTDFVSNSGATFYLTGVQLEVGEQATPFEHRSYGDELARCQRYYRKIGPSETSSNMPLISGGTYDTTQFQATYTCEDMRTQPTLETSGTAGDYQVYSTGGKTVTAVPALDSNSEPAALDIRVNITGATAGQYAWLRTTNTTAYLAFDAEL